jgi:metal-responsive CopG/Arc/MetJ family transcriptional regulator
MRNTKKRGRGRPPTGQAMPMFPLRIPAEMLGEVDAWVKREGLAISRPEALRQLIRTALDAKGKGRKG